MQRLLPLGLFALMILCGCGTTPTDAESTREVVLQYLGSDAAVGTSGPFGKGGIKELDVLSPHDRQAAIDQIDRGAVLFVIFGGTTPSTSGTQSTGATRIILVRSGRVVGDYRAVQPAPAAPATGQ